MHIEGAFDDLGKADFHEPPMGASPIHDSPSAGWKIVPQLGFESAGEIGFNEKICGAGGLFEKCAIVNLGSNMRRSEINRLLGEAEAFLDRHAFCLPPFARWTVAQWKSAGAEADEIRSRRLGWDVTDFGSGNFDEYGLLLFTLRNGLQTDPANKKVYAEKIMIVREGQITPYHFHFQKTEDIINRGAGRLVCRLKNSTPDGDFANTPVQVSCDGVIFTVPPDGEVKLEPGESITLIPGLYHMFYAEKGAGTALVGEVSSVNDDAADNRFHQPLPRYPAIEEDEPPVRFLCSEYPAAR